MCNNGVHGDDSPEQEKQAVTKKCTDCKETKPVTEYHKNKGGKYGVRSKCKPCRNAAQARWIAENPEYRAKYYADNRDKVLAHQSEYAKANPEKFRARNQRRRAKKRNAAGDFTSADWKARLAYHGYKCIYCGVEKHETTQGWLTCEHLIPLSRGGSNWPSNLAPSCHSCNSSKGSKTHLEYLDHLNGK